MGTYEVSAIVQGGCATVFFAMSLVAARLGRWTLVAFGWFTATFFMRLALVNWGRDGNRVDLLEWSSRATVVLVHNLIIMVLAIGLVTELAIREWERDR